MMRTVSDLLELVDEYQARTGYADSTAGLYVFNDTGVIARVRQTQRMWPDTIEKYCSKLEQMIAALDTDESETAA